MKNYKCQTWKKCQLRINYHHLISWNKIVCCCGGLWRHFLMIKFAKDRANRVVENWKWLNWISWANKFAESSSLPPSEVRVNLILISKTWKQPLSVFRLRALKASFFFNLLFWDYLLEIFIFKLGKWRTFDSKVETFLI